MTEDMRLFRLGNKVLSLSRKIQDPLFGIERENVTIFLELLDLINDIRLGVQREEPKHWWDLKVKCNAQDILAIQQHVESLELNYELRKVSPEDVK